MTETETETETEAPALVALPLTAAELAELRVLVTSEWCLADREVVKAAGHAEGSAWWAARRALLWQLLGKLRAAEAAGKE